MSGSFSPVEIASTVALSLLGCAMLLCLLRLAKGPTLPDRVLALDLMAILLVGLLVLLALSGARPDSMRVAIVLALTNFVGTTAFAIYIHRRAKR